MGTVASTSVHLLGVEGGFALSRFRWATAGLTVPTPAQANSMMAGLHTIYTGVASSIPAAVTAHFDPVVTLLDEATGAVTGVVTATAPPSDVPGSGVADYVSGTGARIDWFTGIRRRSREMRGATFIVPLQSTAFTPSGDVFSGIVSTLNSGALTYLGSMTFAGLTAGVYGRPRPADLHFPAEAGQYAPISVGSTSATPAFLRRRRS